MEFLQAYGALALLVKCEDQESGLSLTEYASLVDLSALLRLDFMCWFIPKDL